MFNCAKCGTYTCRTGNKNKLPAGCPMREHPKVYENASAIYREEAGGMACHSARIESAGYGVWPRLREVMEFARLAGYHSLGLAFCAGLRRETREVCKILEDNGFNLTSAVCKTGSSPKEELGLRDNEKVRPGQFEPICNPVAQALLLNKAQTELNVLLGLCVGHDSLFIKYSEAPITVLAVKDRVTGHNPLAAVYASHYFQAILKKPE